MNGHPVVQIVDEIALHAVENLDFVSGSVPRVGKGLGHAVVRDGNGGMAPADGLTHHLLRVGQRVHAAHAGVQMQLYPLYLGGIFPFLVRGGPDEEGCHLDILPVPGRLHFSLHRHPHARLQFPVQLSGFGGGEVFLNRQGPGVVRQVQTHAPKSGAARLSALKGENLADNSCLSGFQVQRPHRHGFSHGLFLPVKHLARGSVPLFFGVPAPSACFGLGRTLCFLPRRLSRTACAGNPRIGKPVCRADFPTQRPDFVSAQLRPGFHLQFNRTLRPVDGRADKHGPVQLRPQGRKRPYVRKYVGKCDF
ncbi:hypothetical protein SDC9_78050 [bioreactor metagenome]|uniref:Uncharacterized protein n=1 Tax=bioreactor metagenome TaxID=1076179 RepID=A0A644YSD4_9ZZZZ